MRALLIINPVSGDDEPNTDKVAEIKRALAGVPFVPEVTETTPEKSASRIAKEAVEEGVEIILVGGGDGTVGEVARELINTPSTLGIIPIGTFNNVARSLDIPAEIEGACRIIAENHIKQIDVGLANDSHPFLEAAGAGLDAALFPLGEEIKEGRWTRWWKVMRLAFQYQPPNFSITFDRPLADALPVGRNRKYRSRELQSKILRRRAMFVVVANGPYYGGGFTVAPAARMNDGRLTISVYRNFSRWELVRHFQSIAKGKRHYSSKIETFHVGEVSLETTSPVPTHVDGKPLGDTPLTVRILPGALRVLVSKSQSPVSEPFLNLAAVRRPK